MFCVLDELAADHAHSLASLRLIDHILTRPASLCTPLWQDKFVYTRHLEEAAKVLDISLRSTFLSETAGDGIPIGGRDSYVLLTIAFNSSSIS